MTNFKIGDEVKVLQGMYKGRIGTVIDTGGAGNSVKVKLPTGSTYWKLQEYLEYAEDAPAEFQVGDKVRSIKGQHVGKVGKIMEHYSGDVYRIDFGDFTWLKRSQAIEKVEPKVGDRVRDNMWGEGIVTAMRPPGYGSADQGLIMETKSGSKRWTFIKDVEILEDPQPKFQPGDRVRVIGNHSQGIGHHFDDQTVGTIVEPRKTFYAGSRGKLEVNAFYVNCSGVFQTIAAEDLELAPNITAGTIDASKISVQKTSDNPALMILENGRMTDEEKVQLMHGLAKATGQDLKLFETDKLTAAEKLTMLKLTAKMVE